MPPIALPLLISMLGHLLVQQPPDRIDERSPFSAVKWNDGRPHVLIDGEWYELLVLNDLPVKTITDHCQKQYGGRAAKRFSEDLVRVLTELNHAPGEQARLKLRPLAGVKKPVEMEVAMTREKRSAARDFNREMEDGAAEPRDAVPPPVQRRHAAKADPKWRSVIRRHTRPTDPPMPKLSRAEALADLDALEAYLVDRFAYLKRGDVDYQGALDAIRAGIDNGIRVDDFAVQLQKVICLFGDGHSGVDVVERMLPAGYASYLLEGAGDRLVAFKEDRSAFLDPARPFVKSLDGHPVEKWLAAAEQLAPQGAPHLTRRAAIRNLRFIAWLRREIGAPDSKQIQLELVDQDGQRARTITVPLAERKPIYGDWPRSQTRLLDGNIGYLRIARMDESAARKIPNRMADFANTDGLVIDVRGNGGGSRDALLALIPFLLGPDDPPVVANVAAYRLSKAFGKNHLAARYLFPAADPIWSDAQRRAIREFARQFRPQWSPPAGQFSDWHYLVLDRSAAPDARRFDKPVVVLMNGDCFSATDIFLSALQGLPRVTLMGSPSGGGSGFKQPITLPKSRLRISLSSMASFRANGRLYDGEGITPDISVPPAATDFIGKTDTQLDAAIKHMRTTRGKN